MTGLNGLLNLNKPRGITSRDAVDLVARPLKKQKVRVGHAGTLDPLATGVLVLCVGPATRLIELVQDQTKVYRAVIRLGATSDTLDADGTVTPTEDATPVDASAVRRALDQQVGTISQMPPTFSALKVGGVRAYELARAGREVELKPRDVRIDRIDLLSCSWPLVEIEVECGSGTYIRSIARDLGESLGCGGLIEVLTRTRIGPFRLEDAIPADADHLRPEMIPGLLLPSAFAARDWPSVAIDEAQVRAIGHGQTIRLDPAALEGLGASDIALIGPDGGLVALAVADGLPGVLRPRKVLAAPR